MAQDSGGEVAGALPAGFNGKAKATVTGASAFAYPAAGGLTSPATGTITAQYQSDAQGGRKANWATLDTIWGEFLPLRSTERLQLAALQSNVTYRFRVRRREDITNKMRLQWTPNWPKGGVTRTIEIGGVIDEDNPTYILVDCLDGVP